MKIQQNEKHLEEIKMGFDVSARFYEIEKYTLDSMVRDLERIYKLEEILEDYDEKEYSINELMGEMCFDINTYKLIEFLINSIKDNKFIMSDWDRLEELK